MPTKRILVLANSFKKHGRCVAGRELIDGATQRVAGWVRPITSVLDGTLMGGDVPMRGSHMPRVMEVVDVNLERCANDPPHPEDWLLAPEPGWTRVREANWTKLAKLEETPPDLWLDDRIHTDRATPAFVGTRRGHQSLYLIRPSRLRIEMTQERNARTDVVKPKTRARFEYRGTEYLFGVTDPVFIDRFCHAYPPEHAPPATLMPTCGDACLLCVSLTPQFRGFHYKVAATILPLPGAVP